MVSSNRAVTVTVGSVDARDGYPALITATDGTRFFESQVTAVVLRRRPLTRELNGLGLVGGWELFGVWPEDADEPAYTLQRDTAKAVYEWLGPELRIEVTRWYPGDAYDLGNWRYTGAVTFLTGDEEALTDDIRRDVLAVAGWLYEQV